MRELMRLSPSFLLYAAALGLVFNSGTRPLLAQNANSPKISTEPGSTSQDKFEDEGEGKENDFVRKRMSWFHDQRAYPNKTIPRGIRQAAVKARDRKVALEAALRRSLTLSIAAQNSPVEPAWTLIGPQTVDLYGINAGRVSAIAIDPSNTQIVYAGGAEGGVWKSINGGTTWTPMTDSQVSLAVGSIALDPSNPNTIFVGTGEENFSIDSYYGAGILKSTDAGQTWTQIATNLSGGPCGGQWVGAVAVHPANGQIVLAGVEGCYFGSPAIYRSTDGGQTWSAVLTPPSGNWMPVTTIVFDPTNGNLAYAATYNNGLYKSTDAGVTWNPADGTGTNVLPSSNLGRATLAIAPSNTSILYTAIANSTTNDLLGMYKSVDGGANWTPLTSAPNFCATQCWYDIVLAVSPANPNFVAAGGVFPYHPGGSGVVTSADGGTTWVDQSSGLHPDTHALAFTPDGSTLYTGDDGGVWSTANPTASQVNWTDLNSTFSITEFYPGISMDQSNVNHTYIGTQDNGTQKYTGSLNWTWVTCGDGGATAIDNQTTTNIYVTCEELSMETSADDGSTWNNAINGLVSTDRTAWVPPMVMDPVHPKTLYFGTYRVYQTTNGAALWAPISGDLTTGGTGTGGTLSTIAVAPTDPNTVYTGSNTGQVNVTRNALSTTVAVQWTNVTSSTSLPNRSITWIAVDPTIATTAYVGFSGFTGFGDSLGHIFQTTNAGTSWTDISSDLPNTPVNAILVDPDTPETIFIGTDIGAFYTTTAGASWSSLGTGLPNVVVTGLGLHEASRTLRASTHGRSVWDLNIASLLTVPTITTVSPTLINADAASFPLTVNGAQFSSNTVVVWDGSPLTTTFVNNGQVTATVPAADLLNSGAVTIAVMNGAGGKLSNSATVSIQNPAPTLASLSQTSIISGGASFTLTATGSDFVPGSKIQWDGTALATAYGSQTSLSATIPAGDIATAGSASVTILNPAPGGGTSGALTVTIGSPTLPALTAPAPGSTLGSSNVTFTWTTVTNATKYNLCLGLSGPGSSSLYVSGWLTTTSATVPSIPAHAATVYARLFSQIGGVVEHTDFTYAESTTPAAISTPAPGKTLGSSGVTFTWTTGYGVTEYQLALGLNGTGSSNLYASGWLTTTSATVPTVPAKGATIYARLYSMINGRVVSTDYTYTETLAGAPATMTSPAPGSTLGASGVQFTWTTGTGVSEYQLALGLSGVGSSNLYVSGWLTTTSTTVTSLPAKGATIYARLYSMVNGEVQSNDYTYVEQ